jgi:sigma-B regulation protein RsbU (phosphoserine phosphatase)
MKWYARFVGFNRGNHMKRLCLISLLLAALFVALFIALPSANSSAVEEIHPKQILILASYNPGMKWEDSIDSAIRLRFAIKDPSAVISTEYMDTKRIDPNQTRLDYLKSLYIKKYKGRHFDLIIASNTDAFNFMLKNGDAIFPGTPVVFCGVVNFDDKVLAGKHGFTGVVEAYNVSDTLALMLHLHPHTQHIAVVTDLTTTGKANRDVLDRTISGFKGNVSFEFLDNLSADELRARVASIANNSLILLMTFNRDRNGRVLTYEDSSELIRDASPAPIYSVYDFYLGYGVVGGKMISGTSQGSLAADLALRVLHGEPAERIPVVKNSPTQYMFDMFELNRFGIPLASLPPGSGIINQPYHARANLTGMNLSGLDLSGIDLNQSEMQESDLRGTNLSRSSLVQATMFDANLAGANLSHAFMPAVDLHGSNL